MEILMATQNRKAALICGIDEVGRGPLAGPVVASAVILPPGSPIPGLKDSKKLTPSSRLELSEIIRKKAITMGYGWIWQDEIDKINIHRASLRAMLLALDEALESLLEKMDARVMFQNLIIRIDGKFLPNIQQSRFNEELEHCDTRAVIRGDSKIPAISAASILAKVARDRWMVEYHRIEPVYGFDRHKGYPTPAHKEALRIHGPSAIQRRTFTY